MKDEKNKLGDDKLLDILPKDIRKDLMYIQSVGKKLYPDLESITLSEFLEFIPEQYHHFYAAQFKAS